MVYNATFFIYVADARFIPTLQQVEDIIRLLDSSGLAKNDYPIAKANEALIKDMRNKGVIRLGKDLKDELKDPERHKAIEKYMGAAGLGNISNQWMRVQGYDPSMFGKPHGKECYFIDLIPNPRLPSIFRFKYSEDELPYVCYKGDMYITDQPPGSDNPECTPLKTKFAIYSEWAGAVLIEDFYNAFTLLFRGFLMDASSICRCRVCLGAIYE
jgi:hypothetical protein